MCIRDSVSTWKRELAYRASKRLQDLMRDQAEFDTTSLAYRVAIRRALQRAALLVCGDLLAARSVLLGVDVAASQDGASSQAGHYLRLGEGEMCIRDRFQVKLCDS